MDVNKLIETISEYFEVKSEQVKLRILKKLAKLLAVLLSLIFLIAISLFLLLFVSFALTQILNEWLDSNYLGYLLISGFYLALIIGVVIAVRTKALQKVLEKFIINLSKEG
ncbi:MAG: hypothetical protein AAF789_01130 [Bacteroidota bacterium]